jgi:SAM-dependent methyltransferase
MMNKLNLGCGEFRKAGYVNVDFHSVSKPDVTHDLNVFPYPFESEQFDVIEADHLLEHLNDPFMVMREIHRIAKSGCKIQVKVPHFSRGFTHAEHKRGFDVSFPSYFNPDFNGGFQGFSLKCTRVYLHWFAQHHLKKTIFPKPVYYIACLLGMVIDFWANLSPFFCSRFWCFLVGGFEEIIFSFEVKK